MGIYSGSSGPTVRTGPPSLKENTIFGSGRIGIFKRGDSRTASYALYELTDHLGNVRAVIQKTSAGLLALTNKTDYYPFGSPMPNKTTTDGNYRYAFQGQEKDPETGIEAFELRLWDGRIGRLLTVDPQHQYASLYLGMGNNPISRVDPDGGTDGDGWIVDNLTGEIRFDPKATKQQNAPLNTTYLFEEGSLDNLPIGVNINSSEYLKGNNLFSDGGRSNTIYIEEVIICKNINALDTSTLGKNILGLTYPGGDNPKTYAGDYDYSYVPKDLAEYPAIGHDRRYDNLGLEGASGLFKDSRAIGADWKFVIEEVKVSIISFNPKTKFNAIYLGGGLAVCATPKTILKLSQPYGIVEIVMWYNHSSKGVTNSPTPKN